MKNKALLVLLPILSITLTSCGQVKNYKEHLEDYVYDKLTYHNDFNILQLTDIHWNANSSTTASKKYLEKVLAEADRKIKAEQGANAKIDLIEITGDLFMLANAYHVDTFVKFFEKQAVKYGFTYTIIWGNHDRHGLYNPNWLSNKFKKAKHCIYMEPNDNLYGRSNFVINLVDELDHTSVRWQIANLDSGASFSETSVSPFKDYDYIRKDQTEWWVLEHEKANETVGIPGFEVPTIAYYHIPQDENEKAWQAVLKDKTVYKNQFFRLEEFAANESEEYASNFIDEGSKHNLKAAFMGHAHNVDWTVEYREANWTVEQQNVVIGLGVKTGTELYFAHIDAQSTDEATKMGLDSLQTPITENFDLIGASLVTLKDTLGNFDLEHLYLNERSTGDFVSWQKWKW